MSLRTTIAFMTISSYQSYYLSKVQIAKMVNGFTTLIQNIFIQKGGALFVKKESLEQNNILQITDKIQDSQSETWMKMNFKDFR
ncbi:MAG: hypothetical protein ACTSVU_02250, partial [Promethearchaeota archaeon]